MDKDGKIDILVLEDAPERRKWFRETFKGCHIRCTKTVLSTIKKIKLNKFDLIFLDRDLGDEKESGDDVAYEMMVQKLAKDAVIVIHTVNPVGQQTMKKCLDKYHKNVYAIPYTQLLNMRKEDFGVSSV